MGAHVPLVPGAWAIADGCDPTPGSGTSRPRICKPDPVDSGAPPLTFSMKKVSERQLEGLRAVGLQSEGPPDAADRVVEPAALGHGPGCSNGSRPGARSPASGNHTLNTSSSVTARGSRYEAFVRVRAKPPFQESLNAISRVSSDTPTPTVVLLRPSAQPKIILAEIELAPFSDDEPTVSEGFTLHVIQRLAAEVRPIRWSSSSGAANPERIPHREYY